MPKISDLFRIEHPPESSKKSAVCKWYYRYVVFNCDLDLL